MFLRGTPQQVSEQMRRLQLGQTIMDAVGDQARSLQRGVGPQDRQRLDQYFTGVRDLEKQSVALNPFSLSLRKELAQAQLDSLAKDRNDRIVRFTFAGIDDFHAVGVDLPLLHLNFHRPFGDNMAGADIDQGFIHQRAIAPDQPPEAHALGGFWRCLIC